MNFINVIKLPESLSGEENLRLLKEIKNGNEKAKEKFICHNLRLITFVMGKRLKNYQGNDIEDIFQAASVALMKAVENFDLERNTLFSTFAIKCIDTEINNYFRNNYKTNNLVSLNEKEFEDREEERMDYLKANVNIEEEITQNELGTVINDAINSLNDERMKDAIKMYFIDEKSQGEIASKYNVSRQFVSHLIKEGLKKMKYYLKRKNYDYKLTLK